VLKSGTNGFQGVIHYGKRWGEGAGAWWLCSRGRRTTAEVKWIDFNSLCLVAGFGEVKMMGSGSVEDFMGVNLRRRWPVVTAAIIDARFTRRNHQKRNWGRVDRLHATRIPTGIVSGFLLYSYRG
jgi:hypothetical protein